MGVRRGEWNAMETNLRSVAEVPQTPPRFAKTPPPGVEGNSVWVSGVGNGMQWKQKRSVVEVPAEVPRLAQNTPTGVKVPPQHPSGPLLRCRRHLLASPKHPLRG